MKTKKVIVCGSKFGQFYIEALMRMKSEYELVGIVGKGSRRTQLCAEKYNLNLYAGLDEIPDDVEIAYVIVRTGVMGGEGSELAIELMERGIHVFQEQPVHVNDLKRCIKKSLEKGVFFGISNLYYHMSAVSDFIGCVNSEIDKEDIVAVELACTNQITFAAVDILMSILKDSPMITFDNQQLSDGQFATITGKAGTIPLTVKIYNVVDPDDPDNYYYYLQQIHVYTTEGVLSLLDVHGPIIWKPQFSVAHDYFINEGSNEQRYLKNKSNYYLKCESEENYEELFRNEWIGAISRSISCFSTLIDTHDSMNIQSYIQKQVLVASFWGRITQKIGYPKLLKHKKHSFQRSKNIVEYLKKRENVGNGDKTQQRKINEFVLPDEVTYAYSRMAKDVMNKACLDAIYFSLCKLWDITETGRNYCIDELVAKLEIKKENYRILLRWIKELNYNGYICFREPDITFKKLLTESEVKQDWNRVKKIWIGKLSGKHVISYYLQHIENIRELLSGELDAMLLLFPEGNIHLANKFYRENLMEKYLAYHIGHFTREYIAESTDERIRILEIGAGTGATTDKVLAAINEFVYKVRYTYSDISMYFLNYAKEKFKDFSFIDYQTFDIEKDFYVQGIEANSINVIIAAGMLNNAIDTGKVIRNLVDILVPGGMMLIAEPVGENYELMLSQSFLMDVPMDDRSNDNTTFLSFEQWKQIFWECGIKRENLFVLPEENHPLAPFNQKLFMIKKSKDKE